MKLQIAWQTVPVLDSVMPPQHVLVAAEAIQRALVGKSVSRKKQSAISVSNKSQSWFRSAALDSCNSPRNSRLLAVSAAFSRFSRETRCSCLGGSSLIDSAMSGFA
jgi:hypothetical protein